MYGVPFPSTLPPVDVPFRLARKVRVHVKVEEVEGWWKSRGNSETDGACINKDYGSKDNDDDDGGCENRM